MHVHPERRMAIMNEVHDITYVLIWRNNIMMRSMYSAVSGLKAHQTRMDVIGNNIANVNTVAFKSQSMTFSEVFYQTTQTASGPNAESGKGGTNAKQIGILLVFAPCMLAAGSVGVIICFQHEWHTLLTVLPVTAGLLQRHLYLHQ